MQIYFPYTAKTVLFVYLLEIFNWVKWCIVVQKKKKKKVPEMG